MTNIIITVEIELEIVLKRLLSKLIYIKRSITSEGQTELFKVTLATKFISQAKTPLFYFRNKPLISANKRGGRKYFSIEPSCETG